jgi:hypothetical protein
MVVANVFESDSNFEKRNTFVQNGSVGCSLASLLSGVHLPEYDTITG